MTDLEKDDIDYVAEQKLQKALRMAEPYDGPWIDYERTYTIGAVVHELKVREESLRVLAAAYRAEKVRADDDKERAEQFDRRLLETVKECNRETERADKAEAELSRLKSDFDKGSTPMPMITTKDGTFAVTPITPSPRLEGEWHGDPEDGKPHPGRE